ncbi:sugar ABC transporter ATP-binding protein (plasmid) [Rhodococcus opacus]|uniref:sugar ABC transporter ATP-binding protein n=1 Tax=Rhodococcus opacus TaxID=37919 RepID=UPI0034D36AD0
MSISTGIEGAERDVSPIAALTLRGISKSYGANRALGDVSFDVQRSSIHGLLGGNGSGKSTLIKILAGVVEADAGRMRVGDSWHDLAAHSPRRASELGLRFVHQQNSTFHDLSVAENLAIERGFETGVGGRINWAAQRRWARTVLDRFEIPVEPGTPVSELGAAMQMMVSIARALQDTDGSANGILILDEPTASLPRHEVDVLLDALTRFAKAGQSIVLVTHRLPEVMSVCDRATVIRDGSVAANLERPDLTHDRLVAEIMGRPLASLVKAESASTGDAGRPVLTVKANHSGAKDIVVGAGEVVGLAGLLGSGRSSLLRRIFGLNERVEEVIVDGVPVVAKGAAAAMAAGVAYVPEDRPREALFPDLSISENLSIAEQGASSRGIRISSDLERRRARDLISAFSVKAASERLPLVSLSGGNQQKIILARWMQRRPKVLLLDEPTQGVDVGARAELHRIIRAAASDGAAVLVASSEFEELVALCDRAFIVHDGLVVDEVVAEELTEEVLNDRVYAKEVLS